MPYKLLSYYASPKEIRAGVLVDDMVYDAARVGTNTAYADMMGVLDDWKKAKKALADGVKLIEAGKSRAKGTPLKKVKLAAPVPRPGVVFCAGANYKDHVAMRFQVYNAWPTSVAYSDLNAGDNAIFVEQITLVHEGFDVNWAPNVNDDAAKFN